MLVLILEKTQLDWFDRSICTLALYTNSGTIDVKMYGSALKKIELDCHSCKLSIAKENCLKENWSTDSLY